MAKETKNQNSDRALSIAAVMKRFNAHINFNKTLTFKTCMV